MSTPFDVIVVGSGPAGVSSCFPLLEAGLKVLMVHGGKSPSSSAPRTDFLSLRAKDPEQWKQFIGPDFYALKSRDAVSPKLRVPMHAFAFEDFHLRNRVSSENFVSIGSLAAGGLSNAWGCGVAGYTASDMEAFPFALSDLDESYANVSRRMGISGEAGDDLSEYLRLDDFLQPAVPMDDLHETLYTTYRRKRSRLNRNGFALGRSRIAVLTQALGGREPCAESGNCLWGCDRRSLYSASEDLFLLRKHQNFSELPGFVVDGVSRVEDGWALQGRSGSSTASSISAKRIFLAAGTLATTRMVLGALQIRDETPILSCPTAAFMICLPLFLGARRQSSFALGQHSFKLSLANGMTAFGSTFSLTGILLSEFLRAVPLRRRYGIDLLRLLLSSCVVGNVFLPGSLSNSRVQLQSDDSLLVKGAYADSVASTLQNVKKALQSAYFSLGGVMLPGSFTAGRPGSDIHYAGTLPMREIPRIGQTNQFGEVCGMAGVHVVDGACLSSLSEKSHTLTLMANADRIGKYVARNA